MLTLLQKSNDFIKKREIQNYEKSACQKVVAMGTSNLIDKDLLYLIVFR